MSPMSSKAVMRCWCGVAATPIQTSCGTRCGMAAVGRHRQTLRLTPAATPKQMQLAANPNSDEMVLVVNDSNENDYALVWNGSSWGNLQPLASSTADDRTDIFVAYEQQTGRAMVVYGNGTSSVYYRIWNGSIWSGENSVAPPAGVASYARWTTLASDPNSNRIVMGVQSSDPDGGSAYGMVQHGRHPNC